MSNTRMTFGAVLSTVSDAATSVSTVLNTATKSVGMLDTFVTNAATKQKVRSIIDMETFKERLIEEVSMEDTVRQLKVIEFCNTEQIKNLFDENQKRLSALLK